MREDRNIGKLEDVVSKGSSNISLNKIKEDDGEYPVYGAKGFVKNVSFFQQDKEYLGIIKDGAGIGRVSKHPANSSILATMQYMIPKDGFDIDFIYYFLNSIDFEKHRNGSTIPHIYFKDYKSEPFPLLKLTEQKSIVSKLDKAYAAIDKAKANAQQNLNNAKELFESYLQEVYYHQTTDWKKTSLGELLTQPPKNGWSPPAKFQSESGVPVLTLSSVTGFEFKSSAVKYTYAETKASANYWVNNGELLISRSNTPELVGHVAISENIEAPTIYPDLIMKLKPNSQKISTEFLYYQLRTPSMRKIISEAAHGANPTMKKINQQDVSQFPICYPSKDKQNEISTIISELKKKTQNLKKVYQQKLVHLEELKKSILHKAFNGEL